MMTTIINHDTWNVGEKTTLTIAELVESLGNLKKFNFFDNGEIIFTCFSHSADLADQFFKENQSFDIDWNIGCQIHPVIIGDVLIASGLFKSKSDIIRTIKQNGVKLNRQLVEFNELLEIGDFQNFVFIGGADQFGGLLVSKGKSHAWMVLKSGQFTRVN